MSVAIWVWFLLAFLISKYILRRKTIHFENYIWLLLPVDMYGINIFGATIKPYMIFSIILLVKLAWHNKGHIKICYDRSWLLSEGVMVFGVLFINCINNETLRSANAALLVVVVYVCTLIYISSIDEFAFYEIPDVIIASSIGYGIVFIGIFILFNLGIPLPGSVSVNRQVPGIFLNFNNMRNGTLIQMIRLRGFTIDPNTVIGTFIFGAVASLIKLLYGKEKRLMWSAFIICFACVLLSNSRTGFICSIAIFFAAFFYSCKVLNNKQTKKLMLAGLCVICMIFFLLAFGGVFEKVKNLFEIMYANRSGLTDQFGRMTIWREAFEIWVKENVFWGIGLGQMQYYTNVNRACHNTWLEWLCSSGLIVGGVVVAFFISAILNGLIKSKFYLGKNNDILYQTMKWGTLGTILSLITVDNVTYSYLWFGTAMLIVMWKYYKGRD